MAASGRKWTTASASLSRITNSCPVERTQVVRTYGNVHQESWFLVARVCRRRRTSSESTPALARDTLDRPLTRFPRTAWTAHRRSLPELRWVVPPLLAVGAVKLLWEDLRIGDPLTLFAGLALYGGALIAAPRLAHSAPDSQNL